jgi:hypothetical protein
MSGTAREQTRLILLSMLTLSEYPESLPEPRLPLPHVNLRAALSELHLVHELGYQEDAPAVFGI